MQFDECIIITSVGVGVHLIGIIHFLSPIRAAWVLATTLIITTQGQQITIGNTATDLTWKLTRAILRHTVINSIITLPASASSTQSTGIVLILYPVHCRNTGDDRFELFG
ncbi:hypothetical protein BD410DRAFT_180341 [Rickenella mellea]|uniref:Uncharacterized protein n=1 Tax=Rickenella mellea TaxID=50990 RepID=A0A4Y7PI03_9AGAM|nr:hypothetical protein BD410DRAFT_180341 [Rickenella mellea]